MFLLLTLNKKMPAGIFCVSLTGSKLFCSLGYNRYFSKASMMKEKKAHLAWISYMMQDTSFLFFLKFRNLNRKLKFSGLFCKNSGRCHKIFFVKCTFKYLRANKNVRYVNLVYLMFLPSLLYHTHFLVNFN